MARNATLAIIAFFVILVIIFTQELVYFYTDLLWFENLGFSGTYWTLFTANIQVISIFTLIFIALFTLNYLVLRIFSGTQFGNYPLIIQLRQRFPKWEKRLNFYIFLAALIFLSFILGKSASGKWKEAYLAFYAMDFGLLDPIFKKDISFYIFNLPILDFFVNWMYGAIILTTLYSIFYHLSSGAIGVADGISIRSQSWGHISFLAGILILIKALSFKISGYMLLNSQEGVVFGAGYTDVNAKIMGNNVLFILALIFAAILWFNIIIKSLKLPLYSLAAFMAAWIFLLGIYPSTLQKFSVEPNELKKESEYISYNVDFTRKAYNLDKIKEVEYPVTDELEIENIGKYRETLNNIRLWDYRPLKQTFGQLQEIRLYYKFHDVDIDRYTIDGKKRLVMLAGREMEINDLPENAKTWINMHMKYTHGYGAVMCPVNEVTKEGLPNLFVKDIPPKSTIGLDIKRPEIYYGELTNHYVLAGSREKEFDYPMGDENRYTSYRGSGGVEVNSFFKRLLFSIRFKSSKIMFAKGIDDNTKILFMRNIRKRIKTIAPFLFLDPDPYLVIADGRLKYIIDAYTVTNRYPYAEPFSGSSFNYIRNSVKIVIDAYDGDVKFYLFDNSDPIINTYAKIFPDLFTSKEKMPQEITKHIRYPVTLFNVQMGMYRSYHMKNIQVFYNKEDLWEFPSEIYESTKIPMESYYQLLLLPNQEKSEFALMIPFTPRGKNNLISLAAALNSKEKFGQIIVYKMPKQKLTYGPMQFEARVDQDPDISRQLSLWSQKGSSVIRGNTLILPIGNSLLYVEPLYLKAEQSELPELKRVIASQGGKIVMEKTLEDALNAIFLGKIRLNFSESGKIEATKQIIGFTGKNRKELIKQAKELYQEAKKVLKRGDLAGYAERIKQIGEILNRL